MAHFLVGQRCEFSPEDKKTIITLLLQEGISIIDVAHRFDASRTTIVRLRKEYLDSLDRRKHEDTREKFNSPRRNGKSPAGRNCLA